MAFVALIGLYFVPLLCLIGAAWSYVRYQNEHEDKEMAEKDHKRMRVLLIAAAVAAVVVQTWLKPGERILPVLQMHLQKQ